MTISAGAGTPNIRQLHKFGGSSLADARCYQRVAGIMAEYSQPGDHVFPLTPQRVISPAAYTQAWTWRVAQTHPMGYSEFRYGYWAKDPEASLEDFIGKANA